MKFGGDYDVGDDEDGDHDDSRYINFIKLNNAWRYPIHEI